MACRLVGAKYYLSQLSLIHDCTLRGIFNEILIKIQLFSCNKKKLKKSSAKWCRDLDALNMCNARVFVYAKRECSKLIKCIQEYNRNRVPHLTCSYCRHVVANHTAHNIIRLTRIMLCLQNATYWQQHTHILYSQAIVRLSIHSVVYSCSTN